ncbi:SDR family oxidoreductase [Paroceanicella profunda]|uniref:SDR family oxidoreductase n=1 Tax=Paroceanicella profunda TaxID=2579971 RepID=A0A5B8FGW1_9RHOB|nr:SDR family oxidoreductase [Paroceanicella profunda]QDL91348.1 SDR family oxidoreductase [Paroceanicella profunda]
MNFEGEFAGRGVVITGACGIYGAGLARTFAAEGARLCLTDRDGAALNALLAELPAAAGSFTQVADLADDASLQALVARVGAEWGAADILVNNAGIYPSGFLLDTTNAQWDAILGINLRAPFILTRDLATQMVKAGRKGVVINISSGAARKMRRTAAPYSLSKTALDRLTKGFAIELAEYGIRVNALEPGFAAGSAVSRLTPAHVSKVTAGIPLGRASTEADVGAATLYLASDAAAYVTGATLAVDGGNSIGSLDVHQDKKQAL